MIGLCVAEFITQSSLRFLYFTNWGVYITTIVTGLLFLCSLKYKKELDRFNVQLKTIQDNLKSVEVNRNSMYGLDNDIDDSKKILKKK